MSHMTTDAVNGTPHVDIADELAAGMEYPMLSLPQRLALCHDVAVDLFVARRKFWVAAAAGYLHVAEQALAIGDEYVYAESMDDARNALSAATYYAPKAQA